MVPDSASRASLSAVQAVPPEDDVFAARWRAWQQRNAATSRADARRAYVAFTVVFAGLGAWLGLLLLNPAL